MKTITALEIAAQCWCEESTKSTIMDSDLAEVFAHRLVKELKPLEDAIEMAWGLIANASGGDWDYIGNAKEWKGAAEKWRDEYLPLFQGTDETSDPEPDFSGVWEENDPYRPIVALDFPPKIVVVKFDGQYLPYEPRSTITYLATKLGEILDENQLLRGQLGDYLAPVDIDDIAPASKDLDE